LTAKEMSEMSNNARIREAVLNDVAIQDMCKSERDAPTSLFGQHVGNKDSRGISLLQQPMAQFIISDTHISDD
jgi:hypothetical protein